MKKQTKILIALMCIIIASFVFSIVSFAEEYTVTSDTEFKEAYSTAQDGDTIIIKADITTNFDFGKSITYVIDGGFT